MSLSTTLSSRLTRKWMKEGLEDKEIEVKLAQFEGSIALFGTPSRPRLISYLISC